MSESEQSTMLFCLGIMAGVMATVYGIAAAGSSKAAIISATDAATLVSGFGGAVIGGGISWLLARQSARDVAQKDELQRQAEEQAVASGASLKLLVVTNGLFTLNKHIERERLTRPNVRPHEAIRPMAGMTETSMQFVASDFPTLFKADRGDLANRALLLEPRYRATLSAIRTYNEDHVALQHLLAPFRNIEGDRNGPIQIQGDRAQLAPIALKMDTLDELMTTIIDFVQTDLAEATALCEEWNKVLFSRFGKNFLAFKDS